jgi:cell division protein FtsZ
MTINLHLPSQMDTLRPKITVVGVGGAGGNAVNNMIAASLEGVEFVIANTDAQAIEMAQTNRVVQLGAMRTRGLGAGAKPEVGREAAEEAAEDIAQYIEGSHMVFITAGMGGGTGTGAAPVIARLAKEQGILTVGVVTKPFQFEGKHRMRIAESGIEELQSYVDTLIIIPNQNLFRIANERTTFAEAFRLADEVLHSGVRGVTDLIVKPGLVNLDFADIRAVMSEMGKAMMGTGEAGGERRAIDAAESAISNPLLDDVSLKGAKAVLINITGGPDMTLFEVDEAANRIRDEVDPDANIIFGSTFSDAMSGKMRVSVVATGIDQGEVMQRPLVAPSRSEYVSTLTTPAPAASVQQSQPVIKPFAYGTPKPASTMQPAAGRTAAEIVRQSGNQSSSQSSNGAINDMVRAAQEKITPQVRTMPTPQSAPMAPSAPHKVLRIVDESVQDQDQAPLMKDADSDVFMSPRAERPAQSTLFTSQPVMHPEEEDVHASYASAEDAEEGEATPSLFSRLGKALSGGTKEPRVMREQPAAESVAPARKEVRVVSAAAGDTPEEDYDIPAFLRRQAN